jgi:hypothetical protein
MLRKLLLLLAVIGLVFLGLYAFVHSTLASNLVRSTLEAQLASYFQQPVRVGTASASLFPRISIDLGGVTIGDAPSIRIREIRIATGLRGLLSRIVTDAEVIVVDAQVALPLPFPLVPEKDTPAGVPASGSGITIQSVRTIALQNLTLTGSGQTLRGDLGASLEGDRLAIDDLTVRAGKTSIRATGHVTSLSKRTAELHATAESLDLDEVVDVVAALTAPGPAGRNAAAPDAPLHLTLQLAAKQGQFASYDFQDLSTTIVVAPARLTLAPLQLHTFGGTFSGRLDVDTRQATPRLRLAGTIEDADVAALLEASGSAGGLTGRLRAAVSLDGSGAGTAMLIRTARGTIDAAVTNGSLPHLDLVRPIVLAFGKPSGAPAEGSGSTFSRLGGTFTMADGTLKSDNIAMKSRDLDVSGSGSLRIDSAAVDARTNVILSEELTAQAGTDLRRYADEHGRVIVPATIGGTLSHPSVSVDVAAAAQRAVGNELKRRAKSFLEGLFKKKQQD